MFSYFFFFYQEKNLARKVMDYIENTRLGETVVKRNTVEQWEKHFKQFTQGLYEVWTSYKCREQFSSEFIRIGN